LQKSKAPQVMDQWWGKGVPGVAQCNSTLSKASRT